MIIFPTSPVDQQTYRVGQIIYVYSLAALSWTASNGFTNTDYVSLNRIRTYNNTESVSTDTGALTVVGGAGIGGDIWAGGTIYSNSLPVLTEASLTAYGVTEVLAGTGISVNTTTGIVTVSASSTSTSLQRVTEAGSSTNQAITITNATSATSTLTGALTVAGGVGLGQDRWVQGQVYSEAGTALYTPRVSLSSTPPVGARVGDFWYDANSFSYQYIKDGTSTFWIQVGSVI